MAKEVGEANGRGKNTCSKLPNLHDEITPRAESILVDEA